MKGLIYHGAHDVRCESLPDPTIAAPDEAIVRIRSCGLCGSDLHPYHVDSGRHGYCLGHEAVGEVVEIGRAVTGFRPGDRVAVAGSISCGECPSCRQGMAMLCTRNPFTRVFGQGIPGVGGCQAEAVAVPVADANLLRLPVSLPDELGVMLTDTLPTAWYCARRGNVGPGLTVAVIGLGAVGLQAMLSALAQGAEQVFAIDLLASRRALAASLGGIDAGADPAAFIREVTEGRGVDVVLEAVGSAGTLALAIDLAAKGGTVSSVGVAEAAAVPVPTVHALAKNVSIILSCCSVQAQWPGIFSAFEQGRLDPATIASLVTNRMPLADGAEAYRLFDSRAEGLIKVLLQT